MTMNTGQATPEQCRLICTTQRAASADYDTATDAGILEDARNTLCLPGTAAPGALTVEQDGSPFAEALIALLTPAVDAEKEEARRFGAERGGGPGGVPGHVRELGSCRRRRSAAELW